MPFEHIIQRPEGKKVRFLFNSYGLPGCKLDIGMDVFTQSANEVNWTLLTQSHDEKIAAQKMSVDEYKRHGRHPMFYHAAFGEIIHATTLAKLHFSN
jgi:hypothetical protein